MTQVEESNPGSMAAMTGSPNLSEHAPSWDEKVSSLGVS